MPVPRGDIWSVRRDVYGVPTLFLYEGGAYVQVKPLGQAVEVIDAWDYDADKSRVQSLQHLRSIIDLWARDLSRRDWRHSYCLGIVRCDCGICRFRYNRQTR